MYRFMEPTSRYPVPSASLPLRRIQLNLLPTFCDALRKPSNLMPNAIRSSSRSFTQSHSMCSPEYPLPTGISPDITLVGRRSFPMRSTKPADNIVCPCTVVPSFPASFLRNALVYKTGYCLRAIVSASRGTRGASGLRRQRRHERSVDILPFQIPSGLGCRG